MPGDQFSCPPNVCLVQERLGPEAGPAPGAVAGGGAASRPQELHHGGTPTNLACLQPRSEEAADVPVGHADHPSNPLQPLAAPSLPAGPPGETDWTQVQVQVKLPSRAETSHMIKEEEVEDDWWILQLMSESLHCIYIRMRRSDGN